MAAVKSLIVLLSLAGLLFIVVLFRSDLIVSRALTHFAGRPVSAAGCRWASGAAIDIREASVDLGHGTFLRLSEVSLMFRGGEGWILRIRRAGADRRMLDEVLRPLGVGNASLSGIDPTLRDSLWVIKPASGGTLFRLVRGQMDRARFAGGLMLREGVFRKAHLLIRLPAAVADRIGGKLSARYLASDADRSRLCKVSFVPGRWVLWGRAGRALEATWGGGYTT